MKRKRTGKQQPSKLAIDLVQARSFVLVDEQGHERASLSCSSENGGYTVLHLNDNDGRPRITLQIDGNGNPGLILFAADNSPGVSLAVKDDGSGLSITRGDNPSIISIGVPGPSNARGSHPSIDVIDSAGHRTWSVFTGMRENQPPTPP